MSYPNNKCGECPAWLAIETDLDKCNAIDKHCQYCRIFMEQKFVRHITTDCCYPLEEDGKTVIICGAYLDINIDGKFWERVDKYRAKVIKPVDPYANHK